MAKEGLGLCWEWCVSHMVNAATKMACGLTKKSYNVEMSELLNKLTQVGFDTSTNTTMGDLLPTLMIMLGKGNATKVAGFKPHGVLGMATTIRCVLDKWEALEKWYDERTAKHARDKKRPPPGYPLAGRQQDLIQLLSILIPIILVTKRSQDDDVNQVQVLLSLYTVRMTALSLDSPIRRYDTSPANPVFIQPYQLTSLVSTTRMLLQKPFYHNFFRRYVDADYIENGGYVFEMQLMLHPAVKHVGGPMDEIIAVIARTEGKMLDNEIAGHVAAVRAEIMKRLKSIMRLVASEQDPEQCDEPPPVAAQTDLFDDDIMAAFCVRPVRRPLQATPQRNKHDGPIANELKKWLEDTSGLQMTAFPEPGMPSVSRPESILEFWYRQLNSKRYVLLPPAARIIFAVPSSSAQIESDFGNSGQMVTALRTSTSPQNIDMTCFLHQNRAFVDVCQCPKLKPSEVSENVPNNVKVNLEPEVVERMEWIQMTQDCFSSSSASAFASDNEDETKESTCYQHSAIYLNVLTHRYNLASSLDLIILCTTRAKQHTA